MYKLKTIAFCKINNIEKEIFPKISSNIIRRSAEYKIFIKTNDNDKLKIACKYGILDLIKYYKNKADLFPNDEYLEVLLIKYEQLELFERFCIKPYLNKMSKIENFIDLAHRANSPKMLLYLSKLSDGIIYNINAKLVYSAKKGHLDMVKCLIFLGANVRHKNSYALHLGCQYGHLDVVKFLVNSGADITVFNNHALKLDIKNNQIHIEKYLKKILNNN